MAQRKLVFGLALLNFVISVISGCHQMSKVAARHPSVHPRLQVCRRVFDRLVSELELRKWSVKCLIVRGQRSEWVDRLETVQRQQS